MEWHSAALPRLRELNRRRPLVESPVRKPDPIVEFRENIDRLVRLIRDQGIPCIVCAQPVLWSAENSEEEKASLWFGIATPEGYARPSTAWLAAEMEKYNQLQREVARRYGARFADLSAVIPRSLEVFFDDCHFTDFGNRLVANAIWPELAEALETGKQESKLQ